MTPQPETVVAQIVGASVAWTGLMHLLTILAWQRRTQQFLLHQSLQKKRDKARIKTPGHAQLSPSS